MIYKYHISTLDQDQVSPVLPLLVLRAPEHPERPTRFAPGVLSARSYTEALVRLHKRPLVTATGAYDRSAIMTMAAAAARLQQERTGEPWSVCMSAALKGAWMAAMHARHRAMH